MIDDPSIDPEMSRLEVLRSFSILDTLPEQGYDDVTRLASFICGTPISMVSFVDKDRQWFKSIVGLSASETPRSQSFCANTIPTQAMLVVEDAQKDPRFRDNPLVLGDPSIRFYAGAPILRQGQVMGTVCVIDTVPRTLSADQLSALESLARQTATLLELRKTAGTLHSAVERLHLSQSAGQIATWELDLETGRLAWSGSEWVYGRPAEEVNTVEKCSLCVHPEDAKRFDHALATALQGRGDYYCEFRVMWTDASTRWMVGKGQSVMSSAEGKPLRMVGICMDVTERKMAEAALMQSEKLAAVGRLASTIAHEINNPLEAVMNLIYLARTCADLHAAQPFLDTADTELRRAATITNQALRFHKQSTRPTSASFQQLVSGLFTGRHSRLANAHAEFKERNRTTQPVLCLEGEVRQVLINLVINAIDALQSTGGALYLRGRDGHDWRTGRAGMVITIADTGAGMSPPIKARLFDAFFTTKGIGGTGLGLWISKEIMDRHDGRILFKTRQNDSASGTVFSIFLPFDAAVS